MKKVILYSLNIMTILFFLLSCDSKIKVENEDTLKKISSKFIEENGVEMIKWMMSDSINLMNIVIYKEEYLISKDTPPPPPPPLGKEPTKYIFPALDLYLFYYSMGCIECDNCPLPASLYYIDGYPVLLYDKNKPSIEKKEMPQYLYKSKYSHTKEVDWLVAICRKRQEYIIFKEYWKLGDEVLDELKKFDRKCCEDN